MTKIDFYILPQDDIQQRYLFACRLAEKAFKLGHSIYIHGEDETQVSTLDQLLWSFRDSSFVPHRLAADVDNTLTVDAASDPVQLGYKQALCTTSAPNGLLINLANTVPEFFSRFERVSEIVIQHPQVQYTTRASYRFYRARGYQMQTHDLRK